MSARVTDGTKDADDSAPYSYSDQMAVMDAGTLVIGAVLAAWERMMNISPMDWLALCATLALILLYQIVVHTQRMLELMEGPTERCRYCRHRYNSEEFRSGIGRMCYRRECRKQGEQYLTELRKAQNAVTERWKPMETEGPAPGWGVLSDENQKQRDEELAEAEDEVERMYGGEPEVRKKEE